MHTTTPAIGVRNFSIGSVHKERSLRLSIYKHGHFPRAASLAASRVASNPGMIYRPFSGLF
eukprot:scaffold189803_cov36-Prasinocladus_malaysianus.AAC.1